MGSPSSSSGGKRKRLVIAAAADQLEAAESLQALHSSSRDASGEEGDTTAAETRMMHLSSHHRLRPDSLATALPPTKRQRAGSAALGADPLTSAVPSSADGTVDPGEASDTTEASADIAERVGRSRGMRIRPAPPLNLSGGSSADRASGTQHGSSMAPPPIGKLVHPKGYKTNPPPTGRSVRIYADGVFDLFHLGHMRQLEQAKKAFPDVILLVGVTGDEDTHKRKGLTVLSGMERAETLRHCKWVDEVIENCPWIVTSDFLERHKIDYVAHDDLPYGADDDDDIYQPIKAAGKFLVTQRTEGVSTTGIITKIVRDYEKYIARQFKRGASRQELNVSWLRKNEMDLKRHVQDLRDNIRTNWTTTGQELTRELRVFWPNSRPQSPTRLSAAYNLSTRSPTNSLAGTTGPNDFITGYTLGLIGGVRSWMTKSRSSINLDAQTQPDDDSESDDKGAEQVVAPAST